MSLDERAMTTPEATPLERLRVLSIEASPDWTLTEDGTIAWMVREGPRGAQIGNFVCSEDAEFAVAAIAYVRAALDEESQQR